MGSFRGTKDRDIFSGIHCLSHPGHKGPLAGPLTKHWSLYPSLETPIRTTVYSPRGSKAWNCLALSPLTTPALRASASVGADLPVAGRGVRTGTSPHLALSFPLTSSAFWDPGQLLWTMSSLCLEKITSPLESRGCGDRKWPWSAQAPRGFLRHPLPSCLPHSLGGTLPNTIGGQRHPWGVLDDKAAGGEGAAVDGPEEEVEKVQGRQRGALQTRGQEQWEMESLPWMFCSLICVN